MNPKKLGLASLLLASVRINRKKAAPLCLSVFLGLAAVGFAVPAKASTVGCPGAAGGPFDFPSLTAAIAAVGGGPGVITVSGTCTEAVVIAGVQNLQIIGTPGAALVDPGGDPPNFGAVLEIDNSGGILIQGLSIRVAARSINTAIPVVAISSSNVRFVQCKIEGAGASDGIDMFQSTVRIFGATVIENNNDGQGDGEGIFLEGPSALLVLRGNASGCPLIQNNGDSGIFAQGGGAAVRIPAFGGCAIIQNNGASGVFANLGATINLAASQAAPGATQLLNDSFGVVATNGGRAVVSGPVLIQGNTADGIRIRAATAALRPAFDGPSGPTIQQNGSPFTGFTSSFCCAPPAGISIASNAQLDILAGLVTNNFAPGLIVQDDSSVRIIGSQGSLAITQNPVGVSVTNVSTAAFFLAPSVSGNTAFDLVCGPDSVAYGDNSAVGKTNCPQFQRQANPGLPPKHGKSPIP